MINVRFSRSPIEAPTAPLVGTDFERLGGEVGVRAIVDDFMDRVFDDLMIGFHFEGKPKPRIRELEYRYAAQHLGADIAYEGRPLEVAHGPLRIFDGHFARRLWLLRETLEAHHAPADVVVRWLAHNEAQRELVLAGSCR